MYGFDEQKAWVMRGLPNRQISSKTFTADSWDIGIYAVCELLRYMQKVWVDIWRKKIVSQRKVVLNLSESLFCDSHYKLPATVL